MASFISSKMIVWAVVIIVLAGMWMGLLRSKNRDRNKFLRWLDWIVLVVITILVALVYIFTCFGIGYISCG